MQTTPPPVATPVPQNNPLAVWSLVLGILAMLGCFLCLGVGGLLFAIPAVICAHKARSRIKRSGNMEGDGLSLAGMITGYVAMGLALVMAPLMMAIAIPSFLNARERSMQAACGNNLRQIEAAKDQFAVDNKGSTPTTMAQIVPAYILKDPVCLKQGTYAMGGQDEKPSCSVHGTLPFARPAGRGGASENIER